MKRKFKVEFRAGSIADDESTLVFLIPTVDIVLMHTFEYKSVGLAIVFLHFAVGINFKKMFP